MNKRVIVVTGANRGIGQEICRQLAKLDLTVVLTARHQKNGLEAVADFKKQKLSLRFHPLDVTNSAQILKLTEFLKEEFGRCDGLVNNAGIFLESKDGNFFNTDLAVIHQTMETNVYGPYLLCQSSMPLPRF